MNRDIRLRPLERDDLLFVHALDNNASVMRYWFEEPYASYDELVQIYNAHIQDNTERRFIVTNERGESLGLVELIEISTIHRKAEFQIIISPMQQGKGYAKTATALAVQHAFLALNLHKLSLDVDPANTKAIHIYEEAGFQAEGILKEEFFANGQYHDVMRMCIFQRDYLASLKLDPKVQY